MRKMYVKFKDCIGGRLRGLCDRLTPRQRAIVVIVMVSSMEHMHCLFQYAFL